MKEDDFDKQITLIDESVEKESQELEIPETIGPYHVESVLNRGGMSCLYLATNPETRELLVLKVLSAELLSNEDIVERFVKEAEIIALADHPNIVKLYGHGEWEGGLYIAMEFVRGVSLRQFISQHSMPIKRALEIVRDVAGSLCHLHAHGIVHGDLKPENILLTETGKVKVVDFGIAQLISEGMVLKQSKRIIGTPIYMSPEQRDAPEKVSFPSDIYSLGIIAYELVLGRLSHGVIHLSLVPPGLRKILAKALQPDIEERYNDIVDFLMEISAYIKSGIEKKDQRKKSEQICESDEDETPESSGSDVILKRLVVARDAIIPKKMPSWQVLEVGAANYTGENVPSVFYDFFKLPDNMYGVIMGECGAESIEGLLYVSVLRGMVRTLSRLTTKPVELVTILNELVINDPIDQIFTLSYVIMDPHNNQFHYISCGHGALWSIPSGVDAPRKVAADNIALGIDADQEFLEVNHNWNVGDTIVLNTFRAFGKEPAEGAISEDQFKSVITENLYKPPQKQADVILGGIVDKVDKTILEKRPVTIITIQRTG